jgi:hypothetical protein
MNLALAVSLMERRGVIISELNKELSKNTHPAL